MLKGQLSVSFVARTVTSNCPEVVGSHSIFPVTGWIVIPDGDPSNSNSGSGLPTASMSQV